MAAENQNSNESELNPTTSVVAANGPEQLYEKAFDIAGKIASTELGQFAIKKLDRILHTIEVTAKWSLPHGTETDQDKEETTVDLKRPMPWIPFLATIITLRAVRIGLSVASILIGNEPVSPASMVNFLQTRRRKLRAIKYHGLRAIRLKKQDAEDRKRRGVIGKLTSLLGVVVCRPSRRHEPGVRVVVQKTKKTKTVQSNNTKPQKELLNANQINKKRPYTDDWESDEDLTCEELLDKYGYKASDEEEDMDFVPEGEGNSSGSSELSNSDADLEQIEKRLIELNRALQKEELKKQKKTEESSSQPLSNKNPEPKENGNDNIVAHSAATEADQVKSGDNEDQTNGSQEVQEHSDNIPKTPKNVTVDRLSPKIAQNQNGVIADEEKNERYYDPPSDDEAGIQGSPAFISTLQNHLSTDHQVVQAQEASGDEQQQHAQYEGKQESPEKNKDNIPITQNNIKASLHTSTFQPNQQHTKKYNNNNISNHNKYKGKKLH